MKQLIDKSALVAEIERKADIICQGVLSEEATMSVEYFKDSLISFIDTLEVKEDGVHGTVDYPLIGCDFPNIYPNYKELKEYCDRNGIKDNDKVKLIIIKDM